MPLLLSRQQQQHELDQAGGRGLLFAVAECLSSDSANDTVTAAAAARVSVPLLEGCKSIKVPGLSLSHEKPLSTSTSSQNRDEAEKHAIALLARPLQVVAPSQNDAATGRAELADSLRQNVYVSFAVLVDSRLNAYAAFLARHALALEKRLGARGGGIAAVRNVEDKLSSILSTGAQVTADRLHTRFELIGGCSEQERSRGEGVADHSEASDLTSVESILRLLVSIDFGLMHPNGVKEIVPINFSTTGTIKGHFSTAESGVKEVIVSLDTRILLRNMIEQASVVVNAIVDVASKPDNQRRSNKNHNHHHLHHPSHQDTIPRSASFLAMPPPPSIPKAAKDAKANQHEPPNIALVLNQSRPIGLDLLCQAASERPIVSPDLSGSPKPTHTKVPSLDLREVNYDEGGVSIDDDEDNADEMSYLSLDQCADIVDTCLFGGEFQVTPEPPAKRTKIFY